MNILNELFDNNKVDLSSCEVGDLVVYTVTRGNTFNEYVCKHCIIIL